MTSPKPQTIYVTRTENSRQLMLECGGMAVFGKLIGMSNDNGQLSNTFGPSPRKNIGDTVARKIDSAFNKDEGWLDMPWAWMEAHHRVIEAPSIEQVARGVDEDIDALRHVIGAMALVIAQRPGAGRALIDAIQSETSKMANHGSVLALVGVLEKAVHAQRKHSRRA